MQNHKAKREKAKRRSKLNSHTFCVLSMLPTHLHHMRKAGTIDWVPVSSNHMAKTAPPRAKSKKSNYPTPGTTKSVKSPTHGPRMTVKSPPYALPPPPPA